MKPNVRVSSIDCPLSRGDNSPLQMSTVRSNVRVRFHWLELSSCDATDYLLEKVAVNTRGSLTFFTERTAPLSRCFLSMAAAPDRLDVEKSPLHSYPPGQGFEPERLLSGIAR